MSSNRSFLCPTYLFTMHVCCIRVSHAKICIFQTWPTCHHRQCPVVWGGAQCRVVGQAHRAQQPQQRRGYRRETYHFWRLGSFFFSLGRWMAEAALAGETACYRARWGADREWAKMRRSAPEQGLRAGRGVSALQPCSLFCRGCDLAGGPRMCGRTRCLLSRASIAVSCPKETLFRGAPGGEFHDGAVAEGFPPPLLGLETGRPRRAVGPDSSASLPAGEGDGSGLLSGYAAGRDTGQW